MSKQQNMTASSGTLHNPAMEQEQRMLRGIRESQTAATLQRDQRERIATAALQGLLASTPSATQTTTNAEQYGTRAVRYADALIEALNRSTEAAIDARHR